MTTIFIFLKDLTKQNEKKHKSKQKQKGFGSTRLDLEALRRVDTRTRYISDSQAVVVVESNEYCQSNLKEKRGCLSASSSLAAGVGIHILIISVNV